LYEGIKLHEMETPWVRDRARDLERVLKIADERGLPVQFHSAACGECRPSVLARFAWKFPNVRLDFAHCPDVAEMAKVIVDCPNVWTDVAYALRGGGAARTESAPYHFEGLQEYDWRGRLLFGTDLPVWQAQEKCGLTSRYRQYVSAWERMGVDCEKSFRSFLDQKRLF